MSRADVGMRGTASYISRNDEGGRGWRPDDHGYSSSGPFPIFPHFFSRNIGGVAITGSEEASLLNFSCRFGSVLDVIFLAGPRTCTPKPNPKNISTRVGALLTIFCTSQAPFRKRGGSIDIVITALAVSWAVGYLACYLRLLSLLLPCGCAIWGHDHHGTCESVLIISAHPRRLERLNLTID